MVALDREEDEPLVMGYSISKSARKTISRVALVNLRILLLSAWDFALAFGRSMESGMSCSSWLVKNFVSC